MATGVQGHLETVREGETGLLVARGDAAELADAVARVLDDEPLALGLAGRGRDVVLERFTAAR